MTVGLSHAVNGPIDETMMYVGWISISRQISQLSIPVVAEKKDSLENWINLNV